MSRPSPRLALALMAAACLAACRARTEEDSTPAVPVSVPIGLAGDTVPLTRRAVELRSQVDSALDQGSGLDAGLVYRIATVSDEMAVSRLPFAWSRDRYDLGGRLREIQAMAARITAEVRRDLEPDSIRPDLTTLRAEIERLRTELAEGGGPAPPSLDSLLRGYAKEHTVSVPTGAGPVE